MNKIKALILRTAGTNCNNETEYAFTLAGAAADSLHINQLLENPKKVDDYQIFVIPGGFSYGDDIGAGRLFANEIKFRLIDVLIDFYEQNKLILGICNGFQVLVNLGFLPDSRAESTGKINASDLHQTASLHWNTSYKFESRWVNIRIPDKCNSVFLQDIQAIMLPVAHAEGRFIINDTNLLEQMKNNGQISMQYVNPDGSKVCYPENPNGSIEDIAGINDSSGRILGLMPHPERFLHNHNHPQWTRIEKKVSGDGLKIFENATIFFK